METDPKNCRKKDACKLCIKITSDGANECIHLCYVWIKVIRVGMEWNEKKSIWLLIPADKSLHGTKIHSISLIFISWGGSGVGSTNVTIISSCPPPPLDMLKNIQFLFVILFLQSKCSNLEWYLHSKFLYLSSIFE